MREDDYDQSSPMPPSYPPAQHNRASEHAVYDGDLDPDATRPALEPLLAYDHSAQYEFEAETEPVAEADEDEESNGKKAWSFILELLTVLAVALLAAVILKTYFVQAYEIPSESMENTLIPGDRILVNKLADSQDDLNRGDLVVFVDPGGWLDTPPPADRPAIQEFFINVGQAIGLIPQNVGDHLVKRIIGMPGDRVTCCGEDGLISVNGAPITEHYLKPGVAPSEIPFDVTVPKGYVWVLGDNRANSADSRIHQQEDGFGFVPVQNIEGRAWLIIYPLDRFGTIDSATKYFESVPEPGENSPATTGEPVG